MTYRLIELVQCYMKLVGTSLGIYVTSVLLDVGFQCEKNNASCQKKSKDDVIYNFRNSFCDHVCIDALIFLNTESVTSAISIIFQLHINQSLKLIDEYQFNDYSKCCD